MEHLHWIGAEYYSIPEFVSEARKWGVSRRIKPQTLKAMEWGERIYLVSREKGLKAPVIFGYFRLERVRGIRLDEETRALLEEETGKRIEVVSSDLSLLVKRGCGYCQTGGLYLTTSASVKELTHYGNPKDPELQGRLVIFPKAYPALKNLKAFRGFRPFDGEAFRRDLADSGRPGRPILEDLYYA